MLMVKNEESQVFDLSKSKNLGRIKFQAIIFSELFRLEFVFFSLFTVLLFYPKEFLIISLVLIISDPFVSIRY